MNTKLKPKFDIRKLAATPALMNAVGVDKDGADYVASCLLLHVQGDWGLVGKDDWAANDKALETGARVMSVYPLPNDPDNFWIITEADRSVTTLLLPSDY